MPVTPSAPAGPVAVQRRTPAPPVVPLSAPRPAQPVRTPVAVQQAPAVVAAPAPSRPVQARATAPAPAAAPAPAPVIPTPLPPRTPVQRSTGAGSSTPAPAPAPEQAAASASASPAQLDELARRLVTPLSRLLRAELRADRERVGRLRDHGR
ncbi:extensin [Streptomyces sp. NPDC046371]|uniref:extensin n=1 Tax=Streptomyces sp. NPDC046371 TaxID=3154916 RepID=UPI0033EF3417